MSIKVFRRIAAAVLIVVTVLAFFAAGSASGYAYEVPRMLGMGSGEGPIRVDDNAPRTGIQGPFFETHGNVASMDRDLRDLPQTGPEVKRPAREMGQMPAPAWNGNVADPVVQSNQALGNRPISEPLAVAPAPLITFKGLDLNNWGNGWPPDTHGDVGPTHYIQAVNTSIGIFRKSDGVRLAASTFDNFFIAAGGSGPCTTMNYGDPIVIYDQISGRWIITDFAFAGDGTTPPYYECIAVSKSADPVSGGWWLYTVTASTTALNDYPKFGIWNDGIYMSANMFTGGASYGGVKVWALNRDDLINGAALRSISFQLGTSYFSLLPANLKGALAPAGTPEYFMSDYGSNTSMKLWKFTTNWASPASSTFTGPTSFAVASFTRPASDSVRQLGSSERLDTLGDRLMTWLQYRNVDGTQSLWVSRTVKVSTSSYGIRWMEVRNMSGTPSVYQQGTYAPDAKYRWMPSLAVNSNGDMAVGYSVSSSTMYPAIRYAGRLVSDPLGTLGQTEQSLYEGTGAQSGGYNRWGDYSSMSVDPVDDCTFWFTTEYYETISNDWQTRIGSFKLADCGGGTPTDNPPTVTITSPSNGATVSGSVSVAASASDDHGVTQVEFFVDGVGIGVDTSAPYSASWDTTTQSDGSHTVSAIATDTIGQTGNNSLGVTVRNAPAVYIHVGDLDGVSTVVNRSWNATVTITVVDSYGNPVAGVTVSGNWSGGTTGTASCVTNSIGQCSVSKTKLKLTVASVTFTVSNLAATNYVYDSAANTDPDGDSNGTAITVAR